MQSKTDMGNPKRSTDTLYLDADENHPQFVTAVARGMAILRCFVRGDQYLGNHEIAQRTGLPKPTVSRLTFTLARLGYLNYSATLEKYSLGVSVLALGHAFLHSNDVITIARPLMQELADYTGAAVMLAASDGPYMVLLEICQGDAMFHLKLEPGARVPHGTTALGRGYVVAMAADGFEHYLDALETQCQPAEWPKLKAGIVAARQDYERYGFCFSLGDWAPDLFAVGVPMVSADRSRTLTFNCSGRISIATREKLLEDFGPKLVALRDNVYNMVAGRF